MKRVNISALEKGIVIKNEKIVNVLNEGKHWIGFGGKLKRVPLHVVFNLYSLWDSVEKDSVLDKAADVITIGDDELLLVEKNKSLTYVLDQGTYGIWKDSERLNHFVVNTNDTEVDKRINAAMLRDEELRKYIHFIEVKEGFKAAIFINGELYSIKESGQYCFWKNQKSFHVELVDVRLQIMEVSGQELLTKDKVAIRVNFDVQFKVVDIQKAIIETKDFRAQLYQTFQMALRAYIGKRTLEEMLSNKEEISKEVVDDVLLRATELGVQVFSAGIRDVIFPGEVKDIMNQVLISQKKAEANTITRREETAQTRSLLNTAKLMQDNEVLMQLKEMEYIERIAEKVGEISIAGNGNIL